MAALWQGALQCDGNNCPAIQNLLRAKDLEVRSRSRDEPEGHGSFGLAAPKRDKIFTFPIVECYVLEWTSSAVQRPSSSAV